MMVVLKYTGCACALASVLAGASSGGEGREEGGGRGRGRHAALPAIVAELQAQELGVEVPGGALVARQRVRRVQAMGLAVQAGQGVGVARVGLSLITLAKDQRR